VTRCVYCGHQCHGRTCQYCRDLPRLEAGERPKWDVEDELAQELQDTLKDARSRTNGRNGKRAKKEQEAA